MVRVTVSDIFKDSASIEIRECPGTLSAILSSSITFCDSGFLGELTAVIDAPELGATNQAFAVEGLSVNRF